ncbi:sce7726 family protein [Stutzerimonas nitrititolerans]|uniref:sce7726 family protein n=1 Tax=Stutzerimonas nitrititolerans TaxID=2482751 RepID=UPI0028ADA54A|nr:sce7726 family protein [Stutzerimonas nitrititolerans]
MIFLKEAARLFNSKELSRFADGNLELLAKVASRYQESLGDFFCAKDVFELCYKDFGRNYKNEYYFKNIIAKKILIGRHSLKTATMLSEFRVGNNKADCVILNGTSTCYEIKSEYDNLSRLQEQLDSYLKVFDKVYVVTTEKHYEKLEPCMPASVGVLQLSSRNTLTELKSAGLSESPVDIEILMSSLRKSEYMSIVATLFGETPKTSNAKAYEACKEMLRDANSDDIRKALCNTLKKTRKADEDFIKQLPENLLAAGIEYSFSNTSKTRLIQNLNITFSKDALCTTQYYGENFMS